MPARTADSAQARDNGDLRLLNKKFGDTSADSTTVCTPSSNEKPPARAALYKVTNRSSSPAARGRRQARAANRPAICCAHASSVVWQLEHQVSSGAPWGNGVLRQSLSYLRELLCKRGAIVSAAALLSNAPSPKSAGKVFSGTSLASPSRSRAVLSYSMRFNRVSTRYVTRDASGLAQSAVAAPADPPWLSPPATPFVLELPAEFVGELRSGAATPDVQAGPSSRQSKLDRALQQAACRAVAMWLVSVRCNSQWFQTSSRSNSFRLTQSARDSAALICADALNAGLQAHTSRSTRMFFDRRYPAEHADDMES